MKNRPAILSLVFSLCAVVAAADEPSPLVAIGKGKVVDLTHPFDDKTVFWPTADGFQLKEDFVGITERGYFYSAYRFSTAEHGGTHIDAPVHFSRGGATVDRIPLERLMGEAVLIDVSEKCLADRDYQITVGDLIAWEDTHRRQVVDAIVMLRTGFGRHWPDRVKYLGTKERGRAAVSKLRFPGLHPHAAQWLAENRKIRAIGIDTASIDSGQSSLFASHVTLFKHGIPALENVAHLDKLPDEGFSIIALPMKIRGGSGGPTRIIAVVR